MNGLLENFLAFFPKLGLLSFHLSKNEEKGVGMRAGGGWKIFQKLIRGDDSSVLESMFFEIPGKTTHMLWVINSAILYTEIFCFM